MMTHYDPIQGELINNQQELNKQTKCGEIFWGGGGE